MKKQRIERRRKIGGRAPEGDLEFLRHPFSGIDPDTLKKALIEAGKDAATEYPKLIDTVLNQLRRWSPFQLLSFLAGWGLAAGVVEGGTASKSILTDVEQHHVELLQALAMKLPPAEWGKELAKPGEVTEVIDALRKLTDAFQKRRFMAIEEERNIEARLVLGLQERMRGHTQVVRNWGYFSDVVEISAELYGALDAEFEAYHGFSATDLIAIGRDLVKIAEQRNNDRYQRLRKVFRARNIAQLVRLYYKHFPDLVGSPEEMLAALPKETTFEQMKLLTLSHSDLRLIDMYLVQVDELSGVSGMPDEKVKKCLEAISMAIGSLAGSDVDHFFMGNPVWAAPLVRIGEAYFSPIPQIMFSHIHGLMRNLFETAGLKVSLEQRRAEYLEWKITQVVSKTLPKANLHANRKWKLDGAEYETDLIAVLDRVIILFEAKSASLTAAGLRGAPDRVRRHVRELVVDPSEQSERLADVIRKAKAGDKAALQVTNSLGLEVTNVDTVTRVSVTLDDFSVLASAESELKEAGWAPNDLPLALTLNIADFGCVANILSEPLFFIHYLHDRSRIQKATEILGDELDYLGLYLKSGFNLGTLERGEYRVVISGMSGPIDHYYTSRDAGVAVPKPQPKVHPYFMTVLREIARRDFESWTTAGLDLLRSGSLDEQERAVRGMERLRASVGRNYRNPAHECCMIMIPPEGREGIVMFYVYNDAAHEKRDDIVSQLAAVALDERDRARCTVVGRKLEEWNRPYAFVMIATPPDKEDDQ